MVMFLVILIPFPSAFAFNDDFQLIDALDFKPLTGARINVFQDSKVDWCIHTNNSIYAEYAKISIKEWEKRLNEVTGESVWNMDMHVNTINENICDGHIWFKEIPEKIDHMLNSIAGVSKKSSPLPDIIIYTKDYQNMLLQIFEHPIKGLVHEDIKKMIVSSNHQSHIGKNIERIIKHELGHTLSLYHPNDIWNAQRIMSYNSDELDISDKEIWQVVHNYPNGFDGIQKNQFGVSINQLNNLQYVITTGEWINLTIEIPIKNNFLVADADIRIYSGNGDVTKFYFEGMAKIPDNDHFVEMIALKVNMLKKKTQFQIGFIPMHEDVLDLKIILIDYTGLKTQYDFKKVIKIQDGLFSKELFENPQKLKRFSATSSTLNQGIENEKMEFIKMKDKYYEELKQCLKEKNAKKCISILGTFTPIKN